jgi:hypothetical protein
MSSDHSPSHVPYHGNFWNMKGQVSDSDALNIGEQVAHIEKGRSMTVDEGKKALDIGRAMNAGTEPAMSMGRLFDPKFNPKP